MVSILIPSYNANSWIRQCLDSALGQTYAAGEIIVVDDGSTDGTAETVSSYGSRVRLIQSSHAGGNAARNRLLEASRGEWLQYLDADDYLLPHKVANQMRRVEESPYLDIVYSPVILRDEGKSSEQLLAMPDDADLPLHYICWNALNTNGFLLRRSAVVEVGGWNASQSACQEHELLFRMIENGKQFSLVNEPGAVYRLHQAASVSRQNPLRTIQLQMELLDRMQNFLTRQGALTRRHSKALYAKRMAAARTAWKTDPTLAEHLAERARSTGSWWVGSSPSLPPSFQIANRILGYAGAERLATMGRRRSE